MLFFTLVLGFFIIVFNMIEGYLTTREVAEKLNVSEGRVRQLIAEKRLPTTKIGNSNVIKDTDLELVRDRQRTGRPPKAKGENE